MTFAQALRFRCINSTNNEFQDSCNKLHTKVIKRGYKQQELNEAMKELRLWTDKSSSKRKQRKEVIKYHLY